MKKQLLSLGLLVCMGLNSNAQIVVDTVSVGAGYGNQKWYSLQNDEQGTQSKDNWDLAFEISGYTASILANVQKTNFAVYKAPYSIAQYAAIDTSGISSWPLLYNSDTTWTSGAFNSTASLSNSFDLGWGTYNNVTHIITGDSCYVVKLSATIYKKLKLIDLNGGVYSFEYANLDGSGSQSQSLVKGNYSGKNFIYFDMSANAVVDREPASSSWDLSFVKYISFVPPNATPYAVTGVLSNKGVLVAQADNVPSPASYTNFSAHNFQTAINTIGYDWKEINMSTFAWDIKGDTVFFVKDKPGNIWKLRFTKFSGSSTGNFIFSKEKLSSVGIQELNATILSMALYPNPSYGTNVNLLVSVKDLVQTAKLTIYDINGKLMRATDCGRLQPDQINTVPVDTDGLSNGVYIINVSVNGSSVNQKLIINH